MIEWLSDREAKFLATLKDMIQDSDCPVVTEWVQYRMLEALAACRELMKKHEWEGYGNDDYGFCPECEKHPEDGHEPDCAWAKQLQGYPRKVDSDG